VAPRVLASSVADGALLPLPLSQISISFDQLMWTGRSGQDASDGASVLNPSNYSFIASGSNSNLVLHPESVRWDPASRSAILNLPNLPADGWLLEVNPAIRSAAQVRLAEDWTVAFSTVADLSASLRLDFFSHGTPDSVAKQIKRFYDLVGGFDHLLMMQQAGSLDHARTVKSMTLFAKEVYPQIKDLPRSQPLNAKAAAE
jgi:hypothetical protein